MNDWLPTTPTPPSLDPGALRILLFGRPKIGKSTWVASFPKVLFICPESGHEHLSVMRVALDGWNSKDPEYQDVRGVTHTTFVQLVNMLVSKGKTLPYQTFAIDTIDRLHKMCIDWVCTDKGIEHPQDLKYGKGTDLVNNEFRRQLFPLINLRRGVVFISHTKTRLVSVGDQEMEKNEVSLPGGAQSVIIPEVDLILRADYMTDEAMNTHRVLVTQATADQQAGSRWSLPPKFPMTKNGGYEKLLSYLKGEEPPKEYKTLKLGNLVIKKTK